MLNKEIIQNVADITHFTKRDCNYILETFIDQAREVLIDDGKVYLKGLATMSLADMGARHGRNPQTNEVEIFPATKRPRCVFNQEVRQEVRERWRIEEDDDEQEDL